MYIPLENSNFLNEEHFTKLENEIANNGKYVYLVGDTNRGVGRMRDFVISDSHLNETFHLKTEYSPATVIVRKGQSCVRINASGGSMPPMFLVKGKTSWSLHGFSACDALPE